MKLGPNIWHVNVHQSINHKKVVELVMRGDAVKFKTVGPDPKYGPQQHVLVDIGDGVVLEFDDHEFTVIDVEWPELPPVMVSGFSKKKPGVSVKYGLEPHMVKLAGPACAYILAAAEDIYGDPPKLSGEFLAYELDEKTYAKEYADTVMGSFPAPKKPEPVVHIPPAAELPWSKKLWVHGVDVVVHASVWKLNDMVAVAVNAKAADGPAYVASQEFTGESAAKDPEYVDASVSVLVLNAVTHAAKAAADAEVKKSKSKLKQFVGSNFWGNAVGAESALTPEKLIAAFEQMEQGMVSAAPSMQKFSKSMTAAMEGAAKIVGAAFYGSVADYEQVAADHGLASRVAPNFPKPYTVTVALYKFDGRPAEWEECAQVRLTLEKVIPVGVLVECHPLTPELAAKLPGSKDPEKVWDAMQAPPGNGKKLWDPNEKVTVGVDVAKPGDFAEVAGMQVVSSPVMPQGGYLVVHPHDHGVGPFQFHDPGHQHANVPPPSVGYVGEVGFKPKGWFGLDPNGFLIIKGIVE